MTFTRTLCPLPGCGWHHDQADFDPTVPQPFATEPGPEGVDPIVWGFLLGGTLVVENALKEHLETHELIEWVQALTGAQRRAEKAEAQLAQVRRYCELTADSCHVPTRQTAIDVLQLLDSDGVAAPATQASDPVDFVTETFGDGSQRTRLDRLTDGRVMCCLCFEYTPREGLESAADGSGAVTDVCKPCAARERR